MTSTPRLRKRARAGVAVLVLIWTVALGAHEKKLVGPMHITIGWGDEPAFAGSRNTIDVVITTVAGAPVTDLGALTVDVTFGTETVTLPLLPDAARPGLVRAQILPTRAGTYTFRVRGRVKTQTVDVSSTCSETTFHCVAEVSGLQFPAKDPSVGQLAERVERSAPRVDEATATAAQARIASVVAIVASLGALIVGVRGRRRHSSRND